MCGELDEDVHVNAEIHNRLTILSRKLGVNAGPTPGDPGPLASAEDRSAYMQRLFERGLSAALDDVAGAAETERIDAIAAQAIALARLAGFLAGQLPPDADLFRGVIEALTDGHAEPRHMSDRIREAMQDHHHHHHHGDHDHDHDHDHHHHHHD